MIESETTRYDPFVVTRTMCDPWPLWKLCITLGELRHAVEQHISGRYRAFSVTGKPKARTRSRKPNQVDYPTKVFLAIELLLADEYLKDLSKRDQAQDVLLDQAASDEAKNLSGILCDLLGPAREDHSCEDSKVSWSQSEFRSLLDALEKLGGAIKRYQSSYSKLSEFQRHAFNESMRQRLRPELAQICEDIADIRNALLGRSQNICSQCQRSHDAKLCFSFHDAQHQAYILRLQMLNEPRWLATNLNLDRSGLDNTNLRRTMRQLQSLCNLLDRNQHTVRIIAKGRIFQAYLHPNESMFETRKDVVAMISLRHLLLKQNAQLWEQIGMRRRITLALIIAYYYLHMSGTALWPDNDTTPDVYFEAGTAGGHIDLRRPYLNIHHVVAHPSIKTRESSMNCDRPSLPALGKLLLEVWLGRSLAWSNVDNIEEEAPELREDGPGSLFYLAAARCFHTTFIRSTGPLQDEMPMYNEYVAWVVKGLQYIWESYEINRSDIFGISRESIVLLPTNSKASVANTADLTEDIEELEVPHIPATPPK